MLERVKIKGFRTCRDVELDDLGKVTALVGRNAAGKSNLLQALLALARLACSDGPGSQAWTGLAGKWSSEVPPHLAFEADVKLGSDQFHYTVEASRAVNWQNGTGEIETRFAETLERKRSGKGKETVFRRSQGTVNLPLAGMQISVGPAVGTLHALASLLPADHQVLAATEPLRHFFSHVQYFALDEPAQTDVSAWLRPQEYDNWLAEYKTSGTLGQNVPAQIVHLFLTQKDAFNDLKRRLDDRGLRLIKDLVVLPVTDLKCNPNLKGYVVLFCLGSEPSDILREHEFGRLSQGTRRIVRLMTAMAYDDASVMLLEHPEDGVHGGLVRKLTSLFDAGYQKCQIILSTHSDTLVNRLAPEAIRFVSLEDGQTSARKLSPEELAAASDYINSDADGTLAEFLHSVED